MTARFTLLAALAGLLALPGADAAEVAKPAPTAAVEPIDVLYLCDARPVVVRLRITTDGRPLDAAWGKFATALLAKLDADKSGTLSEKELARLRPLLTLLAGGRQGFAPLPAATPAGGPMTAAAFAEYLRKNDLGPLRLPAAAANDPRAARLGFRRGGTGATPEQLDKAIMELLDANADGKLSVAELAAAPDAIGALDTDENELVSVDELLRRPNPLPFYVEDFEGRMPRQPAAAPVELAALARKGADPALAKRLLARYGPKPAGGASPTADSLQGTGLRNQPAAPPASTARRLTAKEIGLNAEAFAALDQDGDGELDAEELARFGQSPPEVEIALRLGDRWPGVKAAEVLTPGTAPVRAAATGTEAALEVPGVRLDLIPTAGGPGMARTAFRARYRDRFRAADRDQNGYIDQAEANGDVLFRDVFPFLDGDGDGKVFERELTAALDDVDAVAAEAARGVVSVDLAEAGRGLFGLFDSDGDGRLSVRELRAVKGLVERFDANKDGGLTPGEVPRRFTATLNRGLTSGAARAVPVGFRPDGRPATARPAVGPVWFQKMDRNRDGDVSRREFLGTDADFRRLDADGDGLLSPQEAEAAGKE